MSAPKSPKGDFLLASTLYEGKNEVPFRGFRGKTPYFYPIIMKSMQHIEDLLDNNRHFLEKSAFGVCQRIGEILKINPAQIRLYFIYLSFITFGSPLVIYLIMAFWLNIKKYISSGKVIPD